MIGGRGQGDGALHRNTDEGFSFLGFEVCLIGETMHAIMYRVAMRSGPGSPGAAIRGRVHIDG